MHNIFNLTFELTFKYCFKCIFTVSLFKAALIVQYINLFRFLKASKTKMMNISILELDQEIKVRDDFC